MANSSRYEIILGFEADTKKAREQVVDLMEDL
jgi:hypothetical protein